MTKVDSRGRISIPKKLREKLDIREGEEFIPIEIDEETIVFKRIDTEKILMELIDKAGKVDLEELEREVEERGDEVARKKFQEVFG